MPHDILIVGGGIGGAVLANLLGRGGKRVLVLEKNLVPPQIARPEILWPHTVEFLRTLLPADQESRWLLPVRDLHVFEAGELLGGIFAGAIRRSGVQPYSTAGHETRRLLLEHAGCEVLRGVEVRGLVQEQERVVGVRAHSLADGSEREWRASWTIGDDGPGSLVRRECGIPLTPQRVPADMLSFGLPWPEGFPHATGHVWLNPRRAASGVLACGAIPHPGGRGAGIVVVRPSTFENEPAVNSALAEFAQSDPRLRQVLEGRVFPQDFIHIQLQYGNAPRYVHPGAALIGDAAHPVTPAGGQGANLAVADARALAASLLRTDGAGLGGLPLPLADYERLRRQAANRSLRFSRGAALAFALPGWVPFPSLSHFIRLLARWPSLFTPALREVAAAFQ